jgi:hypothetical protein
MWAINTILSTRVYLNLVWLAAKPDLTTINPDYAATEGIGFAIATYGGGRRIPERHRKTDGRKIWSRQSGRECVTGNCMMMTTFGSLWEEPWAVPTAASSITTHSEVVGAEKLDTEMDMKEPSRPAADHTSGQHPPHTS